MYLFILLILVYKSKDDDEHKGMHNLTGIYVEKEEVQVIDNVKFYAFSVIYPNKRRFYLSENENEINVWISKIQSAIGYTNLTDMYIVKVSL